MCGYLNYAVSLGGHSLVYSCIRYLGGAVLLPLLFVVIEFCAGPHRVRLRLPDIIRVYYSVFARVVEGARLP